MQCRWRLYGLVWCLVLTVGIQAQELSDRAIISLLTCAPGEELYAQFGHTALRVADSENDIDIVFNYGIFNFNTDHFYWKFVKGDTWYELGATPAWWFMREYEETGRAVYEQVLALTPEEQENIWQALKTNYQPQNRKYLYNFVFDNCATRPYILIAKTLGTDTIASPYKGHTGYTYRTFIRHYTGAVSWANAGINLLFGPEADRPMTSQQRLFMPEELMFYLQASRRTNGTKLVKNETIAPFETKNTPWYASWPFGLAVYFLLVCTVSIYDRRRLRWSWWLEVAVAMPYVMLLLIVAFLTFFSCHPLVGFGWRLLIIPLTHLCARIIYIVH